MQGTTSSKIGPPRARDPMGQFMRIQIEPHSDLRAAPRSLYRGGRRVDIIEIVDQWYGPGYQLRQSQRA